MTNSSGNNTRWHLLVAIDGSAGARAAVDYTANVLVHTIGVHQITLVAVFHIPDRWMIHPDMALVPQNAWDELRASATDEAEQALREGVAALRAFPGAVRTTARSGRVAPEIARAAQEVGADMIVIGSHRWGELRALLIGSEEHAIVDRTPCPVLVVRPGRDVNEGAQRAPNSLD